MRILIAEDQRDLNQLLKKRLKEAGYSVDACFDGAAVFDYLLGAEYDALVLDIMMPKVDGIQVVRRLRREGERRCPCCCSPPGTASRTGWRAWTPGPTTT